ncbi:EAL domain-containing protein [Pseudooceanicola spongiae]|uniref:EAL domain-containing protein n=2 Tax=Pseudooceanicola spongiae TaxID=2613965 RepID=A0A7L9WIC0_9RHOB|nr:EAL domain-containing protein [Pseudooceanicola spongiae]
MHLLAYWVRLYEVKTYVDRPARNELGMSGTVTQTTLVNALEKGPFVYGYIDTAMTLLRHNAPAADWLGQPGQNLVGTSLQDLVARDVMESVGPSLALALAGETQEYERSAPHGTGTRTSISRYIPECDASGAVIGLHIFVIDITDQKETENEAFALRERFRGAFHHAAIGMAVVSIEGRFLSVNASLCKMLGYTPEELLEVDFKDLTHPDDLAADLANLSQLLEGALDSYTMEKRYLSKSGGTIYAILSVTVARTTDGAPLHLVGQIQDISARKIAEDKLFREHEMAEVTLLSIGDGVITCDPEGGVVYLNPVAQGLTGWSNEAASGLPIATIFDVRDAEDHTVPCPMSEALETGRIVALQANSLLVSKDGLRVPVEDSAAPIRDRSGKVVGGVLVFHDVSHQRAMAIKLEFLAHHDMLTELPNRALFKDRLAMTLWANRREDKKCAVLFCDLDRFKSINDAHGHAAGDEVLSELALRLKKSVRDGDTVCRWAGDEFAILLPEVSSERDARMVASRIVESARTPIYLKSSVGRVDVGVSVGIGMFPEDGMDASSLLAAADAALYEVKRTGRNRFAFHHEGLNILTRERARQEAQLREALLTEAMELHYQPRVSLKDGSITGVEALVRLRIKGELIYPDEFIAIAEDTGLIHDLSRWVLREACRQSKKWKSGPLRDVLVAINMSPMRLRQPDLSEEIASVLLEFDLEPSRIEFEITETMMANATQECSHQIHALSDLGFKLSLDDFGTGFSNLAYLRSLPVDTLKIDRSFVSLTEGDMTIANAIIGLGASFGKTIVAEGIETREQEQALIRLGCDEGQGFLYSKAVPASRIEEMFGTVFVH